MNLSTYKFLLTFHDSTTKVVVVESVSLELAFAEILKTQQIVTENLTLISTDRFAEAQGMASDAKDITEELRDELQNWLNNMPENLQSGSKADELNEAISALDEVVNSFDEIEGADVQFPGMR